MFVLQKQILKITIYVIIFHNIFDYTNLIYYPNPSPNFPL